MKIMELAEQLSGTLPGLPGPAGAGGALMLLVAGVDADLPWIAVALFAVACPVGLIPADHRRAVSATVPSNAAGKCCRVAGHRSIPDGLLRSGPHRPR
jgi:hypothetical protein